MSLKAVENGAMVMQKVLDEWEEKTVKPLAMKGEPINVIHLVDQLPMKTMTSMLFGYDFATRNEEKINRLKGFNQSIINTVFSNTWAAGLPFYDRLKTKANDELRLFQKEWLEFLESYLVSKEREEGRGGVFDHVAAAALSENKTGFLTKGLIQTLVEIVFANQDIAVPSYAWMFAHLSVYPEIAAKMAVPKSTDVIYEKEGEVDEKSRVADKSTLQNTYPEILNFVNESARINPFFVLKTQAMLEKPTKIGNHVFPSGTRVTVDNYSMNHHPKYWKNPEVFDPCRFEDLDEYTKRWCFSRFGHGVRACPGQYHANIGMGNALLRLVTKYELVAADNSINSEYNSTAKIAHHKDIPVDPNQAIVTPKMKLHIRIKPALPNNNMDQNEVYCQNSLIDLKIKSKIDIIVI